MIFMCSEFEIMLSLKKENTQKKFYGIHSPDTKSESKMIVVMNEPIGIIEN